MIVAKKKERETRIHIVHSRKQTEGGGEGVLFRRGVLRANFRSKKMLQLRVKT